MSERSTVNTQPTTKVLRPAREVSTALKRAGIPVGYRYSQAVITTRDGQRITEHGTIVTRISSGRRDRGADLGHVRISLVFVHPPTEGRVDYEKVAADEAAFVARVVGALAAADIPVERASGLAVIVPDPEVAP